MTYKRSLTGENYQGLSTDEKPSGVPDGATFHELDTGRVLIHHQGDWLLDYRMARAIKLMYALP